MFDTTSIDGSVSERAVDHGHPIPGEAGDEDADPLPVAPEALAIPDLYVGLRAGLLSPGDGIVTDRHHASADRYEADDPMNQIGGQLSPFALSGWLRHGCERVLHSLGATACHPGPASGNYRLEDVYDRDLEAGYHPKGSCVTERADTEPEAQGSGCIIYDLFGGFDGSPGELLRRPIQFSPIRRQVDVTDGQAEAHYRQLSTQIRSRNAEDAGQPLRHTNRDVLGNLSGTWHLTLRTLKPEFVGLLCEAIAYLTDHNDTYELQLGGARNFGAGIVDATIINPLYSERELRRVYDRSKGPTEAMTEKDDTWAACRAAFTNALQARIASTNPADLAVDEMDTPVTSPPGADPEAGAADESQAESESGGDNA